MLFEGYNYEFLNDLNWSSGNAYKHSAKGFFLSFLLAKMMTIVAYGCVSLTIKIWL